jgi:hypothetical protein
MLKWIYKFKDASPQTKYFALNWFVYGLALIVSTVYCYGRLDYVRSYKTPHTIQANKPHKKI